MVFQQPYLGLARATPDAIEHWQKPNLANRAEGRNRRIRRKGFQQNVIPLEAQAERIHKLPHNVEAYTTGDLGPSVAPSWDE
jgi:hypothetical protein